MQSLKSHLLLPQREAMSFRTWLQAKQNEDSPIGDLARDAAFGRMGWR
jgi:hypothetical protein